ncbi:head decoration protein [uncultured Sulfitobacter sp.]|uniref:head decoration protein n=1 Tax=uncultured Sulfitobacter sp. TaxID=191468 RepID=UPI002596D796|nr:head decoration protein [uncultured Sulfitobacter sp.]
MTDKTLAGNATEGTFSPDQLYAGEADIITDNGLVANNQDCAQYQMMALVGGELVIYDKDAADGSEVPHGVLPHAMDTTATGYNAATDSPIITGGILNFDALVADGATYAVLKAALAESNANLQIRKLY